MKAKKIMIGIAFLTLGLSMTTISSCNKQDNLSTEEIADLKYLREEEKLARDVYLHAFDVYEKTIFQNISSSEQSHMDRMLVLLNTYHISDPASTEIGIFNNEELQDLYNALIEKTDSSLLDALIVGATIEDVDIFDIDAFISRAKHQDILDTYEILKCGSNNHMRAFSSKLEALGYVFTPQFLSLAQYNEILAGEHGSCEH